MNLPTTTPNRLISTLPLTSSQQLARTSPWRSPQRNLYFQKSYRLMVHSVTFKSRVNVSTYSEYASCSQLCEANQTVYVDDVVDVCVLDVVSQTMSLQSVQLTDEKRQKQVEVVFYKIDQGRKYEIATCFFDMNMEKIIKEQSKQYMKMPLAKGRQGYVEYKFISLRTRQVNFEEFQKQIEQRNDQMKYELEAQEDPDSRALREILKEKNKIIDVLEKKVHELTNELMVVKKQSAGLQGFNSSRDNSFQRNPNNKSRTISSNKSLQKRAISLNVKVTPSEDHINGIIKKFKDMNEKLERELEDLRGHNSILERDVDLLVRQNAALREQNPLVESQPYMNENNTNNNNLVVSQAISAGKRSGQFSPKRMPSQVSSSSQRQQPQTQQNLKNSSASKKKSSAHSSIISQQKQPDTKTLKTSLINQLGDIKQEQHEESRQLLQDNQPEINVRSAVNPRVRFVDPHQELQMTMPRTYDSIKEKNEKINKDKTMETPITESQYMFLKNTIEKSHLEERAGVILQRLKDQNTLLTQKLRLRQIQITKLKSDLQYYINRVKSSERNFEDLRQTSKSMHLQRLEHIKSQRQQAIKDLHGASRSSPSVEFILYKERVQTELQKLRFDITALKDKNRELNVYKVAQDERERIEIAKLHRQNTTLKQEKELFQNKYNEAIEKYTKASEENKRLLAVQDQCENLQAEFASVSLAKHSAQEKLQQASTSLVTAQQQVKKLKQCLQQRQNQWARLKLLQTEYDPLRKKVYTLQKLNQRFDSSLNEIKKFANKIEELYYDLKRETHKKQRNQEITEKLDKELKEKLGHMKGQIGIFFKDIFTNEKQMLNQYKKTLLQEFRSKCNIQVKIIDENVKKQLDSQTKQKLKTEKTQQINLKKDKKIQELQEEIKKIEKRQKEYEDNSKDNGDLSLVQRIKELQKALQMLGQEKKQWIKQKQYLRVRSVELEEKTYQQQLELQKMRQSKESFPMGASFFSNNSNQLAPNIHMNSKTQLTAKYIEESMSNQRKNLMDELARSKEFYSKNLQEVRKSNQNLMRAKNDIQIELQNYKFKEEKTSLKIQEDMRAMERKMKAEMEEKTKQIQRLNKRLEIISAENAKMKSDIPQLEQGIRILTIEIQKISSQLQKRIEQIILLEGINTDKDERLTKYEQAQRSLMNEVNKIKEAAEFAQKEFNSLLNERNEQFMKIQAAKGNEIGKLNNLVIELETKLEEEVMESLSIKRESDQLSQNLQKLQTKAYQLQQQLQLTKDSLIKSQLHYGQVIKQLQNQNSQLQQHLILLAQQSQAKELTITQLQTRLQSLTKQITAHLQTQAGYKQKQLDWIKEKENYDGVILEQQQTIIKIRQSFDRLEKDVDRSQFQFGTMMAELERVREKLEEAEGEVKGKERRMVELEVKLQNFQEKYKVKEEELFRTVNTYKTSLKEKQNEVQEIKIRLSQLPQSSERSQTPSSSRRVKVQSKNSHQSHHTDRQSEQTIKSNRSSRNKSQKAIPSEKNISNLPNSNVSQNKNSFTKISPIQDSANNQKNDNIKIRDSNSNVTDPIESMFGKLIRVENVDSDQSGVHQPNPNNPTAGHMKESSVRIDHSSSYEYSRSHGQDENYGYRISDPHQNLGQNNQNVDMFSQFDQQQASNQQDSFLNNNQNNSQLSQMSQRQEDEDSRINIEASGDGDDRFYQNSTPGHQMDENSVKSLLQRIAYLEEENQNLQRQITKLSELMPSQTLPFPLGNHLNSTQEQESYEQNTPHYSDQNQHNFSKRHSQYSFNNNQSSRQNHSKPHYQSNQRLETKEELSSYEEPQRRSNSQDKWSKNEGRSTPSRQRKFSQIQIKAEHYNSRHKVGSEGYLQRRADQEEQKEALELTIQQLQMELAQVKSALEQEKQSNEKLMTELQTEIAELQNQAKLNEEKQSLIQQIKQEYEHQKGLFEEKIEEVVAEMLQKQQEIADLVKQLEEQHQKSQKMEKDVLEMEEILQENNLEMEKMKQKLESSRREFRKYEEDAELEILSLKEKLDSFAQEIKEKYGELQAMAQKYLSLEQEKKIIEEDVQLHKNLADAKQVKLQSIMLEYQQNLQQYKRTQSNRKALLVQVQDLEGDRLHMQNTLQQMNKSYMMSMKKHTIQLQSYKEHIQRLKQKISQRDEHLVTIKGQISHYNQQCQQLKKINHTLNLQLQKVERSLKDIMLSYQAQQDDLNKKCIMNQKNYQQLKMLLTQKDDELVKLVKSMRAKEREMEEMKYKLSEVNLAYEKFKTAKNGEIQGYVQQYSYKEDEYEKLKSTFERSQEEWFNSECTYLQQKEKYENMLQQYKDKLTKYETAIHDLSTQILKEVEQRPTKQAHDQIVFENQMFKNRIKELEQMLGEKNGYISPKISEQVCQQYRRYKITKESECKDLEDQMQKYCAKVLELQEANYQLRKEIDRLKFDLMEKVKGWQQMRNQLQETKEELQEVKSQIEFYQRKRNQSLNKLLNETDF